MDRSVYCMAVWIKRGPSDRLNNPQFKDLNSESFLPLDEVHIFGFCMIDLIVNIS